MAVHCGVDFHSRQQLVMWCDSRDGEVHERQLAHKSLDDVRSFYSQFSGEVIVVLKAKLRTRKGRQKLDEIPLSPALSRQRTRF